MPRATATAARTTSTAAAKAAPKAAPKATRQTVTPSATTSTATTAATTGSATTASSTAPVRRSRSRVSPRIQPTPALGSLTQPGARDGVVCAACGSDCVTRLAMTLTDGTPVSFTSCHRCEHRTWTELGGGPLAVDLVLDKARKIR